MDFIKKFKELTKNLDDDKYIEYLNYRDSILAALREFDSHYADLVDSYEKKFKKDKFPLKWMQKDHKIAKALEKTRFCDIMNHLLRICTKQETKELAECVVDSKVKKNGIEYPKALFAISGERDCQNLDMAEKTYRKYMKRFQELEIIKYEGRIGSQGRKIYSLGYWHTIETDEGTITRKILWLTQKTHADRLRNFTYR